MMAASSGEGQKLSECTSRHEGPSFGGTVVIDTNEVICSDLTTFGGTLVIDGEVRGNIVAFGTTIAIIGRVDGNVNLYGGTITLQSSSHVHGDIHLYGSRYTQSTGSILEGGIIDHTRHPGWFFANNGDFSFPFWPLFIWVALGLLVTSLLPEHVMFVRTTVVQKARRSLVVGLLSILLAPLILAVSIALILPIPVAIIVALALLAAWALGTVAIGWIVGEAILQRIAPQHSTRPMQIVVGLIALVLIGSL
ncbi:MAG: polymer-forming cytoskeletal protein, partial [Chloroflexota bacterium]|nr:polymer-forming cytoskeletal protein [Chloroflexota bacterium]